MVCGPVGPLAVVGVFFVVVDLKKLYTLVCIIGFVCQLLDLIIHCHFDAA